MAATIKRNLLFALAGFVVAFGGWYWLKREPMEPLTDSALQAAESRWREIGIRDYHLVYRMNQSTYDVQVRDGVVSEVTVDGRRPYAADWRNYAVEGMFELLRLEVENLTDPAGPFAGQGAAIPARVRFNEAAGYPERYLRGGGPAGRSAVIEVLRFEIIPVE
jgi:hypothetical protein